MSLTHAKNNVWTCESCNCKTNPVRAVECAICGTAAPKTKFGRKAHGSYVLVSLNNAKRRAFARVFDLRTDTVLTEELPAAEELDDRVAVALRTALDAGYQAKVRHEKHRRHSTAQTLAKRVHREREAEGRRSAESTLAFAASPWWPSTSPTDAGSRRLRRAPCARRRSGTGAPCTRSCSRTRRTGRTR